MIYFDNAATTLLKPPEVAEAVAFAIGHMGNAGRSASEPAMLAAREIYAAREAVAGLVGLENPMGVAFTSGCTEAVSLLAQTLTPADHVVTTELEHNAVLRPLGLSGCKVDLLRCDDRGWQRPSWPEELKRLLRPDTRFVFLSHGSNLTGNLTEAEPIWEVCRAGGVPLVMDVAQTLGVVPVSHKMADILCFTGHKGLYGPQGTGGLVVDGSLELPVLKTGGTGSDSFQPLQPREMPDLAEAGTPNAHGLCGLRHGIAYIQRMGLNTLMGKQEALTRRLYEGIVHLPGLTVVGDFERWPRLPIVSFAVEGMDSAEAALWLWENHGVATRAGSHCAPLLHRRMGTDKTGLVRCSLSSFNTPEEIDAGVEAIKALTALGRRFHG